MITVKIIVIMILIVIPLNAWELIVTIEMQKSVYAESANYDELAQYMVKGFVKKDKS